MSVRRNASNSRKYDGAKVILAGSPSHKTAASVAPPELRPGQVRCPVCRNGAGKTLNGNLRQHTDLFGHRCYNRSTGEPTGIETPAVVIPERPTPPPPAPRQESQQPRRRGKPYRQAGPGDGRIRQVTGYCHECGRPVSGERRYCGPCLATRGTL